MTRPVQKLTDIFYHIHHQYIDSFENIFILYLSKQEIFRYTTQLKFVGYLKNNQN